VIGLKDNQPTLVADMEALLERRLVKHNFENLTTDCIYHNGKCHVVGIEERTVRVIEIPKDSPHRSKWKGLTNARGGAHTNGPGTGSEKFRHTHSY